MLSLSIFCKHVTLHSQLTHYLAEQALAKAVGAETNRGSETESWIRGLVSTNNINP